MPRIDEVIETLAGATVYDTLDIQKAFWNIPIKSEHKERTAFATSDGKPYEYNVLPFGLSNGSARIMNIMLQGLEWKTCISYLDDIVVFAKKEEQQVDTLRQVFQRIREAKVKLNPEKCELGFLGHLIGPKGMRPDTEKVKAIQAMPNPQSVRDVRYAMGLFGYYRRFVPNFSKLAAPISRLLNKDTLWNWTSECQDAFDALKHKLTHPLVTMLPEFDRPFKLYVDRSHQGLGAILAQDEGNQERIVACASRSLTVAEIKTIQQQNWNV